MGTINVHHLVFLWAVTILHNYIFHDGIQVIGWSNNSRVCFMLLHFLSIWTPLKLANPCVLMIVAILCALLPLHIDSALMNLVLAAWTKLLSFSPTRCFHSRESSYRKPNLATCSFSGIFGLKVNFPLGGSPDFSSKVIQPSWKSFQLCWKFPTQKSKHHEKSEKIRKRQWWISMLVSAFADIQWFALPSYQYYYCLEFLGIDLLLPSLYVSI